MSFVIGSTDPSRTTDTGTRTYMGGLERGERNVMSTAVERLAAKLGVEPLSLLQPV
jgi:hypothetical protein